MPLKPLFNKESWVTARFNSKEKGPTEKIYQNHFYSIFYELCLPSKWCPTIEIQAGNNNSRKVDLGLVHLIERTKYIIELGVNCRRTGEELSAEGLYNRSQKLYSESTSGFIVVMIYTTKCKSYWWPKNTDVQYLIVEHFLDENPYQVNILYNENKNRVVELKNKH